MRKLVYFARYAMGGITVASGAAVIGAVIAGDIAPVWIVGALVTMATGAVFAPSHGITTPAVGRPIDAIEFAIDQGVDADQFLQAWYEGDLTEWPEFVQWLDGDV
jgi:hypothetical protein